MVADDLGVEDFKASDGWLNNTLKYHNMKRIRLRGEADNLTDEEVKAAMDPFRAELQELAKEKGVGPSCMYNADQTGFFIRNYQMQCMYRKIKGNNSKGRNR
jgi:bacterioferritin-associated ferredoxin